MSDLILHRLGIGIEKPTSYTISGTVRYDVPLGPDGEPDAGQGPHSNRLQPHTIESTYEFMTAARGMGLTKKNLAVVFKVLKQMYGITK